MSEKSLTRKIAVYGSLRKGEYNYDRFGGDKTFKHLGTHSITGYELFSLGPYPGVRPASKDKSIVVDVLECENGVAAMIDRMETGAGYVAKEITVGEHTATIYEYNYSITGNSIVESGDWIKFNESRR